jgi:hypothetical protein
MAVAACDGTTESPHLGQTQLGLGQAGFQWVQNKTVLSSGSVTTLTATLANAVNAGDLLVGTFRAGGTLSVSDNVNGAWTNAICKSAMCIFYFQNSAAATAGHLVITLTGTISDLERIVADEFAGAATSGALGVTSGNATTGTSWNAGSTASTGAGQLVYAGASTNAASQTITAGTTNGKAMTVSGQASNSAGGAFSEYALTSFAGVQNSSATLSPGTGTTSINGAQATFKALNPCDGNFHWFAVSGAVCLNGSATGFEYRCFPNLGPVAPLVLNFDGGGACWDGDTCDVNNPNVTIERNSFGQSDGDSVAPQIFAQANYSGSTSPFNSSWNQVLVPYCTGDVLAGNLVQIYSKSGGGTLTANHKGYNNVSLELAKIGALFGPTKVALWGSSGGGLGVDCNINAVHTKWPTVSMYSLNNSGAPLSQAYNTGIAPSAGPAGWGVWKIVGTTVTPNTCPFTTFDQSQGSWTPDDTVAWNSLNVTTVRKALVDDYEDVTMWGFANALGCGNNQDPTNACTVEPKDTLVLIGNWINAHTGAPTHKEYYHVGSCHAEREADGNAAGCNYDDQVASHVKFDDWVRGWLQVSGYTWNTVNAHVVSGNVTIQSGSSPVTYTEDVLIVPSGTNETDSGNVTIN